MGRAAPKWARLVASGLDLIRLNATCQSACCCSGLLLQRLVVAAGRLLSKGVEVRLFQRDLHSRSPSRRSFLRILCRLIPQAWAQQRATSFQPRTLYGRCRIDCRYQCRAVRSSFSATNQADVCQTRATAVWRARKGTRLPRSLCNARFKTISRSPQVLW